MLLKLLFLEGQKRRLLFNENPPKTIYVFSKRIACYKSGVVKKDAKSAVAFAWFVWQKGNKNYPIVKWIN